MSICLHLLVRSDDSLAQELIEQQRQQGHDVRLIDLNVPEPDYVKVLEEVFAANSVAVWS
jgi:Leu/Phe-tRNA-protein transferase